MIGVSKSSPYREALMRLINAINREIPLKKENQVLLVMKLNTEEKIIRFNEWIKEHLEKGKLMATEEEITRAAVKIDKGLL